MLRPSFKIVQTNLIVNIYPLRFRVIMSFFLFVFFFLARVKVPHFFLRRLTRCYLAACLKAKVNFALEPLLSVKSSAFVTSDSISAIFHPPALMCLTFLKRTFLLFIGVFLSMSGLSFISEESYSCHNASGDLKKLQIVKH